MSTLRVLLLTLVLASPVLAQTPRDHGASIVAKATESATQLQTYLDDVLKTGSRPDLSKSPASDLLGQVFNLEQLEGLPPAQGDDLTWLVDWVETANGVYKSIVFFGIARPVNPQTDAGAIQRNFTDYEDQAAAASNFLLRILARETQAAFLFMDQLPPPKRTQVRIEGFYKLRAANDGLLLNLLSCIVPGIKPTNARLVSAAIRDTGPVWTNAILPADRTIILATLFKAEAAVKDDETRKNLSAIEALLAETK